MKNVLSLLAATALIAVSGDAVAQQSLENLLLPAPTAAAQPAVPIQQAVPQALAIPPAPAGVAPQVVGGPVAAGPDDDFEKALQSTFPMTPDQIQAYRGAADANVRASVAPLSPGRPVSRSLRLTLKPGEATPVVRAEPGVVSTLTFSDATGQPWPVETVVTGNPDVFVAQQAGQPGKSNIVLFSALQAYIPSNMVVTLTGHPVPITMALGTGSADTDYRIDVQVSSRGPNALADAPSGVALAATDDGTMMSFLDGVPPTGAARLRTTSSDVEVWAYGDLYYVRTPGEIVSPGYSARSSNVSGVNVFSMTESPVLLVSNGGRMSSVQIVR